MTSDVGGSGVGMILASVDSVIAKQAIYFSFRTSNNKVEYEALLAGLRLTCKLGVQCLKALSDFQLVVGQVRGEYEAKAPILKKYLEKVKEIILSFFLRSCRYSR